MSYTRIHCVQGHGYKDYIYTFIIVVYEVCLVNVIRYSPFHIPVVLVDCLKYQKCCMSVNILHSPLFIWIVCSISCLFIYFSTAHCIVVHLNWIVCSIPCLFTVETLSILYCIKHMIFVVYCDDLLLMETIGQLVTLHMLYYWRILYFPQRPEQVSKFTTNRWLG